MSFYLLSKVGLSKYGYNAETIAKDEDRQVRELAQAQLAKIKTDTESTPLLESIDVHAQKLQTISRAKDPFSRLALLFFPLTASETLTPFGQSKLWWERYAVAQHPNAPAATICSLREDPNCLVRAAAKANLF